jgi:hypothetical protein
VAAPRIDSSYAADVWGPIDGSHFSPPEWNRWRSIRNEAADWVLTFQRHAPARGALACRLMPPGGRRPARAQGRDTSAEELIRAAAEIKPSSAAFPTVAYHHARLLEEVGHADQARALLDRLLAGEARSWPRSAQNLLHARRLRLVSDQPEFLTHAQRFPAAIGNYAGTVWAAADSERTSMLDEDAVWLFNRQIPIEALASLLKRTEVRDTLRARLALSAWTRAVLLERHDLAHSFAEMASIGYPELRTELLTTPHAGNPARIESWLMLHPGPRPGSAPASAAPRHRRADISGNWWCRASEDRSQYAWRVCPEIRSRPVFHPGWDQRPRGGGRASAARRRRAGAQLDSLGGPRRAPPAPAGPIAHRAIRAFPGARAGRARHRYRARPGHPAWSRRAYRCTAATPAANGRAGYWYWP